VDDSIIPRNPSIAGACSNREPNGLAVTRPRLFFWFENPEVYESIRQAINDEPELPPSFQQWLQTGLHRIAELEATGVVCQKVSIDPQQYFTWCRTSGGIECNLATLGAYTIMLAQKQPTMTV
jgi:hypothetical protein